MGSLHSLTQQRALTRHDKPHILRAHKRGETFQPLQAPLTVEPPIAPGGRDIGEGTAEHEATARLQRMGEDQYDAAPDVDSKDGHFEVSEWTEDAARNRPECIVCYDNLDNSNTPIRDTTSTCEHEPNVCCRCIIQSLETQSYNKIWDQIECPSCSEPLDYDDMHHHAGKDVFERCVLTLKTFLPRPLI